MDLLACGGLAALELVALQHTEQLDNWSIARRFLALLLLQYAIAKVYRAIIYPNFVSPLRHLPGPKDHNLIFGQELKKFRASSPASIQLQWMRTWPDAPFIRYVSLLGTEVLLVNSLASHKAVLQTYVYDFVKPPFFARLVGEITGTGLLFAEGAAHRHERRLLAGPFSVPSMRKLLPVFREKAKALSGVLEQAIGTKPHGTFEAMETLLKSTMDTIGVTVLGIELDSLSSTYPLGFQELYSRLLHQGSLGSLISLVNAFVPIRRVIPLEANYRFVQANADLRKMLRGIVEKRMADLADGTFKKEVGESKDLLTYMLEEAQLRQQETGQSVWSVDDIVGHVFAIGHLIVCESVAHQQHSLSGHETTATTLAWSLYVLATHHSVQERLRSEINSLLERTPEPDYGTISSLPFLHNFVREVLRVYPSSYMTQRQALRDLPIENITIPRGAQVEVIMSLAQRNPLIWGADADVFDADRWDQHLEENPTTSSATAASSSPFAFEAFLQGPRNCPGRNLALAQIKAALVELLARWRFRGVEDDEGRLLVGDGENGVRFANPSLTLRPKGGLNVRFERV
ncbi:cytochrome P450 [Hypoxylon sp. FL1284]|nr:cytochrome P450 [Hypoxylon sp. FL1284]